MNVLTGALKLFFRELKEPLFTFALFDKFLNNYSKYFFFDYLMKNKVCLSNLSYNT